MLRGLKAPCFRSKVRYEFTSARSWQLSSSLCNAYRVLAQPRLYHTHQSFKNGRAPAILVQEHTSRRNQSLSLASLRSALLRARCLLDQKCPRHHPYQRKLFSISLHVIEGVIPGRFSFLVTCAAVHLLMATRSSPRS